MGIDPITEDYMSISPYQFAHNNPVWKLSILELKVYKVKLIILKIKKKKLQMAFNNY